MAEIISVELKKGWTTTVDPMLLKQYCEGEAAWAIQAIEVSQHISVADSHISLRSEDFG